MMNLKKKQNNVSKLVLGIKLLVLCALVFFVGSRIWYLFSGPPLSITKPENGSVIPAGVTLLQGKAPTATNVWISGISIPIDTEGVFAYEIYIPKGLTKLPVVVKNRYGTSSIEEVVVWGE